MTDTLKVSVLIVSYNVSRFLDESIRSIKRSKFNGDLEIIVVDNNSFDETVAEISAKHPDITLIQNSVNIGFGKAINQAAKVASGNYLFIVNPDTVIEENTISTLTDFLLNDTNTGLVGPKVLNPDGSLQKACKRSFPTLGVALPKILGLDNLFPNSKWAGKYNLTYLDPNETHSVDAVSGSCMMLSKDLFIQIDGFDERFFMYGEDIDLCYKVHEKGLSVKYVPLTSILHFQGESVRSAPFDSIDAFYDAMILFSEKHFSKSQSWLSKFLIRSGVKIRQSLAYLGAMKGTLLSVLLDAVFVFIAFILALPITFKEYEPLTLSKGAWPLMLVPIWLIIGALLGVYSKNRLSYSRAALMSIAGATAAATLTYFLKDQIGFSRKVFLLATVLITVFLPGWRIILRSISARKGYGPDKESHTFLFNRRAAIIGADESGLNIMHRIRNRFDTGLNPLGFIDKGLENATDEIRKQFLGSTDEIRNVVNKYRLKELVFASSNFSNEEIFKLMDHTKDLGLTYRLASTGQEILLGKSVVMDLGDLAFIDLEYNLFKRTNRIFKRIFEILLVIPLIVITLPLQFILLILGKLKKIEFWGKNGVKVTGRKFDVNIKLLSKLPLLYMVLRGSIWLIGLTLTECTSNDPKIIDKPGLTGLYRVKPGTQIRNDENLLDRYYIQHQNFAFDVEILIKTLIN